MYLALRTDNPKAEIYLYEGHKLVTSLVWQAHRELSATIHLKLKSISESAGIPLSALSGIIFYSGPGSFTGLRIGAAVANALGASFDIPVIGVTHGDWLTHGVEKLTGMHGFVAIEPFYGSEATTTKPKK